ncbi:N-ethylammeline chlorohydrolase [Streptococcus pneumoniae]|nr:N-ethylammeline chlorohydrolase [Streptococcus pneumoniae]
MKLTKSVTIPTARRTERWFEEIFEEYKMMGKAGQLVFFDVYRLVRQVS